MKLTSSSPDNGYRSAASIELVPAAITPGFEAIVAVVVADSTQNITAAPTKFLECEVGERTITIKVVVFMVGILLEQLLDRCLGSAKSQHVTGLDSYLSHGAARILPSPASTHFRGSEV